MTTILSNPQIGGLPAGLALDGEHLYWARPGSKTNPTGAIGRSGLAGQSPQPEFITGAYFDVDVAVDGGHVYWSNFNSVGTIGRANLDGSAASQSFISGLTAPGYLAVDALEPQPAPPSAPQAPAPIEPEPEPAPHPAAKFKLGDLSLNRRRGTATLAVALGAPGKLTLTAGKAAKSVVQAVSGAGTVKLPIVAKGATLNRLRRKGRVTFPVEVTYVAKGRRPRSKERSVTLVRSPGR